jgi:hypothetical protein
MYEIYRRDIFNGKLKLITEFETIEQIVTGFWKGESIIDNFGYTDAEREERYTVLFGEEHLSYDYYDITCYKYIVAHNFKIVAPDRLLGVWREWKYQQSLRKGYWVNRILQRRQGRKRQAYGHFRQMNTKQERTWAHAWDDEEFAPKPRVARTNHNLPDSWDDIHWWTCKSWKVQSKRKHQWKEK